MKFYNEFQAEILSFNLKTELQFMFTIVDVKNFP
jgi:hypothetical protein